MKVVIQRSKESKVLIADKEYSRINHGYVILVGICKDDTIDDVLYITKKIINLRVFSDNEGKLNKSILDINGEILLVSQFTLYADTKKGNRPSFTEAMQYDLANDLYEELINNLEKYVSVKTGCYGEDMNVMINNDGPITIIIDSKNK